MSWLCWIGRHKPKYVGYRWEQVHQWLWTGYDHECTRCHRKFYFGTWSKR